MGYFLKRIFFFYLKPYWKQVLIMVACFACMIAFYTVFPLGIKFLIDMAITPHDARMLVLLIIGMAVLYVIYYCGVLGSDYVDSSITMRLINDLRLKMFDHLQQLPANFYTRTQSGEVMTRFSTDINALENALAMSVLPAFQYVPQVIINIVVLFLLDVRLAVLTTLLLPLSFILPKIMVDRAARLTRQRREQEDGISSAVQESFQAHTVARSFGLRSFLTSGFAGRLRRLTHTATRSNFATWLTDRAAQAGQWLIQLVVITVGAIQVFNGTLSIGSLVGFISLLNTLSWAVASIATALAGFVPAVPSLERIESLLNEKILISDTSTAPLRHFSDQIHFDNVDFSYAGPGGKPNLEGVNFSIPFGSSVAFVGRSGSGKSTILNLLMRFYDPDRGRVMIDENDIRQVNLASLRSQMGVVFQDAFLFNISLRENIRMGALGASDADVEEAAHLAGVHENIIQLPEGYDTLAGESGKHLSGGQRQRLTLARAILRHPAILLLDESTSALDPETEKLIYGTLHDLRGSCTILSVTHRLAPITDMDQIIVMDQGRLSEQGTHAELMSRMGLYYSLFTCQSGFNVSPDGRYAEVTPQRLGSLPLFAGLDQPALEDLAAMFVPERFDAGQTVVRQGEPGEKFYVIARGKVAVSIQLSDGQVSPPNFWQDGDFFGEIALLGGGLRTATVQSLQPTLCLSLQRQHFLGMLGRHPSLRSAIEEAARQRRAGQN